MKKLIFILITICCLTSCGTPKKGVIAKKEKKKNFILPPDVDSNKYSKKRNRN